MKNLEEFKQICAGPVWDGDLISKDGRDALIKAGYVARRDGWNLLTVDGVDAAVLFGLLSTIRPLITPALLSLYEFRSGKKGEVVSSDQFGTLSSSALCPMVAFHVPAEVCKDTGNVRLNGQWFSRVHAQENQSALDKRWCQLA